MDLSGDSRTTGFFDNLRIIPYQKYSGAFNMALDYILAQSLDPDEAVLRFYGWEPYCITLGYHQDARLVNRDKAGEKDIHCVRRPTGGSAILHAEELTYSFIVPRQMMDHLSMYQIFHETLATVLLSLGFPVQLHRTATDDNYIKEGARAFACFNRSAYTEIKYQGKKIVGSAQKIYQNSILQHGSILLGRFQDQIIDFLAVDENKKKYYRSELVAKSISLNEIKKTNLNEIRLADSLTAAFQPYAERVFYRYLTPVEIDAARKQEREFQIYAY